MVPKVSVLMVTYNHEAYIAQAIESVLAQQVDFAIELIIGEDCSTDGTRRMVQDYQARHPDRIRALLPERNLGAGANFAQIYRAAHGQYLAVLEGDDYWTDPSKLRRQVEALDQHPQWSVCFHRAEISTDGRSTSPLNPRPVFPRGNVATVRTVRDVLEWNCTHTSATMYRAGLVRELPPGFADLPLGDWPLLVLHALHGEVGFIDRVMAVYREHEGGNWSTRPVAWRMAQVERMFRWLRPIVNRATGSRRLMYEHDLDASFKMLHQGYRAVARRYALHALAARPWQPYCWRLLLRTFGPTATSA